jgi:hypothetical protein
MENFTPGRICFYMRSIVAKTSDSSVLVDAAEDAIDPVRDDEDNEGSLEGDLVQKSFDKAHIEDFY